MRTCRGLLTVPGRLPGGGRTLAEAATAPNPRYLLFIVNMLLCIVAVFHTLFCPLNDAFGPLHSLCVFLFGNGFGETGVARFDGVFRECSGFLHGVRDGLFVLLYQREQIGEVMRVRKANVHVQKQGFNRLFRRLLRVEAQVFEVHVGLALASANQVASSTAEPFARIIRRKSFVRHDRQCILPAERDE